jgi:hypothetical protein
MADGCPHWPSPSFLMFRRHAIAAGGPMSKHLMILIGLIVLLVVATTCIFRQRDTFECDSCHAQRHDRQWRLGWWQGPSLPLTPASMTVVPSHIGADFFGPTHRHTWRFAQGSPYYAFGLSWGGCALGRGRNGSPLALRYERDEGFRQRLQADIASGTLDRALAIRLLSLQRMPAADDTSPLAHAYGVVMERCSAEP